MKQKMDCINIIRNQLLIAGTKDWPGDAIDDFKLPFGDTLIRLHEEKQQMLIIEVTMT